MIEFNPYAMVSGSGSGGLRWSVSTLGDRHRARSRSPSQPGLERASKPCTPSSSEQRSPVQRMRRSPTASAC